MEIKNVFLIILMIFIGIKLIFVLSSVSPVILIIIFIAISVILSRSVAQKPTK
jgi:purine-cytosine permease-like protein